MSNKLLRSHSWESGAFPWWPTVQNWVLVPEFTIKEHCFINCQQNPFLSSLTGTDSQHKDAGLPITCWRVSENVYNTSRSENPCATMRADAFISRIIGSTPVLLCVHKHNRDCMTISSKTCFHSLRKKTLSLRFLSMRSTVRKRPQKSSSFSRPFKPCFCSSLDRAAFARTASCNNSDTLTRALLQPRFHLIQHFLIKRVLWQTFRPLGFSNAVATDQKIRYFHLSLVFIGIFVPCIRPFGDKCIVVIVQG